MFVTRVWLALPVSLVPLVSKVNQVNPVQLDQQVSLVSKELPVWMVTRDQLEILENP